MASALTLIDPTLTIARDTGNDRKKPFARQDVENCGIRTDRRADRAQSRIERLGFGQEGVDATEPDRQAPA